MPRGIPNARVQVTSDELANDVGVHDDYVLDLMSPSVDYSAEMVRNIEPIASLGFEFTPDERTAAEGGNGGTRSVEYERFMQQPVVIKIFESNDPNSPWVCQLGVNGRQFDAPRGLPIRVPRFFVERLAQSQERSLRTIENRNVEAEDGTEIRYKSANAYDFAVIEDKDPRGRRWLANMLRQGS